MSLFMKDSIPGNDGKPEMEGSFTELTRVFHNLTIGSARINKTVSGLQTDNPRLVSFMAKNTMIDR